MIYISSLEEMPVHARTVQPSHLVSLVEPEQQPATPPGFDPDRHLRLEIHDIDQPIDGYLHPEVGHVRDLVRFLDGWPAAEPLLVHCIAGISRSTAAALVALSMKSALSEAEAARRLRAAAPHAQPNRLIVALADTVLGRNGRLIAARAAMGPATDIGLRGPLSVVALD
jgi:predicted protein tyrosine phosphatase